MYARYGFVWNEYLGKIQISSQRTEGFGAADLESLARVVCEVSPWTDGKYYSMADVGWIATRGALSVVLPTLHLFTSRQKNV